MEYNIVSYVFLPIIITILCFFKLFPKSSKSKLPLPPGPKPWPIIGNIHQLGNKPHQTLAKLAKTYGPIMSLKLGAITTVVVSSPEIAKEMFLKHDLVTSSRTVPNVRTVGDHDKFSMVWLPVGPRWRELRKVATIQLFTNLRLDSSQDLRLKKLNELLEYAQECCEKGQAIDIGKAAFTSTLNLLSNTFFSTDLASHDSSYSQEFRDVVWSLFVGGATRNVSDYFPLVKSFDLQGMKKKMGGYFTTLIGTFERIIDERLKNPTSGKGDVLDTLLSLAARDEFSIDLIKHMLVDLFMAGTDTTSSSLEWIMTELMRNPDKMEKAQDEIDQIFGKNGPIQESDISKLPYLQAVVKETFRMHPAVPFLVPHRTEEDVVLGGYLVPKNAQIWVNGWAVGRDPNIWPDPLTFSPERLLGAKIDIKGRDFELMPFGTGRRICPGMPLAHRMLHLILANLIHSFDWKHKDGISPKDIDVDERFGVTMAKLQPLEGIPLPRQYRVVA